MGLAPSQSSDVDAAGGNSHLISNSGGRDSGGAGAGGTGTGGSTGITPEYCADFTLNYTTVPATVLILLDASASMSGSVRRGEGTRWELVGEALFSPTNGLITTLAPSARFGLALYSSLDGFAGGACPAIEFTDYALDQEEKLRDRFEASSPLAGGDTPTGEALEMAVDHLLADATDGPRYLVLITDGEPDTCAVPDPQRGQPEALAAATLAYESGIKTYIVGISSDIAPTHLQEMSNLAQGVRREAIWGQDADAIQPIQASEQQGGLAGQIKGLLGDVRSCSIPVDKRTEVEGTIELDERELKSGEDFRLEDGELSLLETTCQQVLGDAAQLKVHLKCSP